MTLGDAKQSLHSCPNCGHMSLSWSVRCREFICLMRQPECTFHEAELEYLMRMSRVNSEVVTMPDSVSFGDLTLQPANAETQAQMKKLQSDILKEMEALEAIVAKSSTALAGANAEIFKLEQALSQEARTRDRCEKLMGKLSLMLGGPAEWVTQIGVRLPPPESGNLYADVFVLVEEMVAENQRLREQVATLQKKEAEQKEVTSVTMKVWPRQDFSDL